VYDGNVSRHIQWAIVDAQEANRKKIIEVKFNAEDPADNFNDNGWFGFGVDSRASSAPQDLSEFAEGAVVFDMQVEYAGAFQPAMDISIECVWPCASQVYHLIKPEISGSWKTYSIPIASLIKSGLKINSVNNVLTIRPTWGLQKNQFTVRLDNVRLEKIFSASPVIPTPPIENLNISLFKDAAFQNGVTVSSMCTSGCQATISADGYAEISALDTSQIFGYELGLSSLLQNNFLQFYYGKLMLDVRVLDDAGSKVNLSISASCFECNILAGYDVSVINNGVVTPVSSFVNVVDAPSAGKWISVEVPIRKMVEQGLDLKRIDRLLVVRAMGPVNQGYKLQFNNVHWEYRVGFN
jgi:hypothetical protein